MATIPFSVGGSFVPPLSISVKRTGDPTERFVSSTGASSGTITFNGDQGNYTYEIKVTDSTGCTVTQTSTLICCQEEREGDCVWWRASNASFVPFESHSAAQIGACTPSGSGSAGLLTNGLSVGSYLFRSSSETDCSTVSNGFYYFRSCDDPHNILNFTAEIVDGYIVSTQPINCCSATFELLESIVNCNSANYTVTISQTGGNLFGATAGVSLFYGWSTTNNSSTVTNWQSSNSFTVNSNNQIRYFFVKIFNEKQCYILAGESIRDCSISLDPCIVLLNSDNKGIYGYNIEDNTIVSLGSSSGVSTDIAMTNTKMWVYTDFSSIKVAEYDITLDPWSYSFVRNINVPFGTAGGAGLIAKDNNTLIMGANTIVEVDISSTPATFSTLFTLPAGSGSPYPGNVTGDFYYNSATSTFIIAYTNAAGNHIGQFSYSGTLLKNTTISFGDAYGLYAYNGFVYVIRGNGMVYKINSDFSITYVQTAPLSGFAIYGSAQSGACQNVYYS